ncbi:MAG TPA: rhomboid family intramembrane serine protease [Ferruginibacter sp.]|jgi:membrane associated rhomboid family serine protease|nr:rhomboid family intramembrane serine protease [Ferruginibacter sp.]
MGESDRYGEYKSPKKKIFNLGQEGNALVGLFTINVIFFIVLLTLQVVYNNFVADQSLYATQAVQYFELPAHLTKLSEKPWTFLVYMFSNIGILNMLSNMLWLWTFGYVLQDITGNNKIIPIYLYGGWLGGLFFIAASYLIPVLRPLAGSSFLLGSNAATMAIAVAVTVLAPGFRFFRHLNGGIPLWVLTAFFIAIDLLSLSSMGDAAILSSHVGGGIAGFLFVYFLRRGKDGSIWMNSLYDWFMNLFNPHKKSNVHSIKEKVFYSVGNKNPYKKISTVTQQRVDEILDKINQQGYHFLTDEEKDILKRAAEADL